MENNQFDELMKEVKGIKEDTKGMNRDGFLIIGILSILLSIAFTSFKIANYLHQIINFLESQ